MCLRDTPSRTLQYTLGSSSPQSPSIPTFDPIADPVTNIVAPSSSSPAARIPLSSARADAHYMVMVDYAAPAKLRQPGARPMSQRPLLLPTIDSGDPLQWPRMRVTHSCAVP